MRIAIFSDNFFPELGGIKDSAMLLGDALAHEDHEVDYYVPSAAPEDFRIAGLPVRELDLGPKVHVHRLPSVRYPISSTGQTHFVLPTGRAITLLRKRRPDVIHTQTFFGVGLEALLAAKVLRIPLVGTNHMAMAEYGRYSILPAWLYDRIVLPYVSWYYNRCDFVTAPSESVFTEMKTYRFSRPHETLSNPIDTRVFHPVSPEKRAALKQRFEFSPHTFIFAGRIAAEKKIEVLIRALAEVKQVIPDVLFAIAGHGAATEELKKLAADLDVADHIRFLGTLSHHELANAYRAADLFAITSTSDTQSLVLVQALACGVPALVVNARALPEYVDETRGLVVPPDDSHACAEGLTQLLTDAAARAEKGAHAATFAERFAWETIGKRWITIYTQTIEKKRLVR